MITRLDSLELTDDVKHYACWGSLSGNFEGKRYCLIGDKWRCDCEGCPYNLEG